MSVTILQAKNKALQLKEILEQNKSNTKQEKQLLKLLKEFINCHASNDAIYTKYAKLKSVLVQIGETNVRNK